MDVVVLVRAGPLDHLDDALELLLDRPAGRRAKGFARNSVYALAGRRLDQMAARLYPKRKAPAKPKAKTGLSEGCAGIISHFLSNIFTSKC